MFNPSNVTPKGALVQQIAKRRLGNAPTAPVAPAPPPVAPETGVFPANDVSTQELLQKIAGFRTTLGLGG